MRQIAGRALVAFVALFFFNAPCPLIVLGAGGLGTIVAGARPEWLAIKPSFAKPMLAPHPPGILNG